MTCNILIFSAFHSLSLRYAHSKRYRRHLSSSHSVLSPRECEAPSRLGWVYGGPLSSTAASITRVSIQPGGKAAPIQFERHACDLLKSFEPFLRRDDSSHPLHLPRHPIMNAIISSNSTVHGISYPQRAVNEAIIHSPSLHSVYFFPSCPAMVKKPSYNLTGVGIHRVASGAF